VSLQVRVKAATFDRDLARRFNRWALDIAGNIAALDLASRPRRRAEIRDVPLALVLTNQRQHFR